MGYSDDRNYNFLKVLKTLWMHIFLAAFINNKHVITLPKPILLKHSGRKYAN